jgi:hypothetical protein
LDELIWNIQGDRDIIRAGKNSKGYAARLKAWAQEKKYNYNQRKNKNREKVEERGIG